ncbi:MAG: hypothetical protein AB8F78_09000 [Saprospiraceae bacterium]
MRFLSKVISYVTHPLLGATYILILLLAVNPFLFGVSSPLEKWPLVLLVFASSFLIPALVILMMLGLEVIPSLDMPEREQRTIPLIAVGMLYLGLFSFCKNDATVPVAYTALVLGCVVGLFTGFFINLFSKISLHAIGMGGLIGAVLVTIELFAYDRFSVLLPGGQELQISLVTVLAGVLLLAGLVGTARLHLKAHVLEDIAGGYLVGFGAMAGAVWAWV